MTALRLPAPAVSLHRLLDPVTVLLIFGLVGFFTFYHRFLIFVAAGLVVIGLTAVAQRRWEIAIPIQTFLIGTWAYNAFEGSRSPLLWIMLIFLLSIAYGFWTLLDRPSFHSITLLHTIYLTITTLIVWELALIIKLFWPVEPWSRTFLVVAAMMFLERATTLRLTGVTSTRTLALPFVIILIMAGLVILTTPIPLS